MLAVLHIENNHISKPPAIKYFIFIKWFLLFEVGRFNPDRCDKFQIPVEFRHPVDPEKTIIFIPCSAHVMKNCVSQLHSSGPQNSRLLRLGNENCPTFGWSIIEAVNQREIQRALAHEPRRVRALKANHVKRDAWSRMRVPAATSVIVNNCIKKCSLKLSCLISGMAFFLIVFFSTCNWY